MLSEEGHGIPREENVFQAKDELDKNHREDSDPSDSTNEGRMYEKSGKIHSKLMLSVK